MKQEKIKDLFDFLSKSKIKAGDGLEEGKYPFYTSSENQTKYLDEFQYEPGCLVFGTGGKASVHFTTSRFATSTDCITIRPKPKAKIDAGYVSQFFKGNMQVLESGFKGAGLKHISKAYLSDIHIPHPEELDDQKRIAHLLGKVEGLIARRKQHLQQLDDLLKSVFLEMFGDPVGNEKGWDKKPLSKLCYFENGDRSSNYPSGDDIKDAGVLFLSSREIVNFRLTLSNSIYISDEKFESLSRGKCYPGDVLMVLRGAGLGKCCVFNGNQEKAFINAQMVILKCSDDLNNSFLVEQIRNKRMFRELLKVGSGSAQPQLTAAQVKRFKVANPPIDLQNQFAAIVEKVDGLKSRYRQSLTDLESLYGALSQKAFKGELDLSRVVIVPYEKKEAIETLESNIPTITGTSAKPPVELPTPAVVDDLHDAKGRMDVIGFWLDSYLEQLRGLSFSAQDFMEMAQQKLWDLLEDDAYQLSVSEYDHVKDLVFQAIENGRLTQNYVDANNQVQITAARG